MRNTGLEEAQAEIKIAGRNINNLRYADDTTLMAESAKKTKNWRISWWKWKRRMKKLAEMSTFRKLRSWHTVPSLHSKETKQWKQWETYFLGLQIPVDGDCSHEIKRRLLLGRKAMTSLDSVLKSREITLLTKVHLVQVMVFFSSHVWMWELDSKESWVPKNWCFWTVVLEKTLECPLDCREIQLVNPKGNQSWIFIGRIDAEAPILWPPDVKNWLIWKDADAGKD